LKISVTNFKAITHIEEFSLQSINILTGVNSGGKSSLIQLILLLKQSVEFRSTESPLKLNRPYVSLGKFENILRKQSDSDSVGIVIKLAANELPPRILRLVNKIGGFGNSSPLGRLINNLVLSVKLKQSAKRKIVVEKFELVFCSDDVAYELSITRNSHGKSYRIHTNAPDIFFDNVGSEINNEILKSAQVGFFSFFPDYIETREGEYLGTSMIDQARFALHKIFANTSYIGPLREEPKDFYYQDDDQIDHIGNKGENAAYILAKHAKDQTVYSKCEFNDNGMISRRKVRGTLEAAVNHWMCDIFGLAKEVKVETSKGNSYLYSVYLIGYDGTKVPITHVGFGVSQIFPILVEGLRPTRGNRLIILEQPEIHLHPRVQSLLFDFISSVNKNISFLIETHSDHMITRMRRRIAESDSDELRKKINLTFVEPTSAGVEYSQLDFNMAGSLDAWPEGFFDQYDTEMRALVKAQLLKKKALRQ